MSVVTDPIADMLTRIRNAGTARRSETVMPSSKMLVAIAKILEQEGYIAGWDVREEKPFNKLIIYLKYGSDRTHAIRNLKRVSKPGLRVYAGKGEIPRVRNGLGIAIVSTSQGIVSGQEARRRGIGGEVLCTVY
jgi:small subunit ribosomal protein S8